MQGLILAAGMGKRLQELTNNNTKCMVNVNGETLIERVLNQLEKLNLNRIIIVVGYKGELLKNYVNSLGITTPIVYVDNPVYDKTNNIYSLYLASSYLSEDDTLLLESDLILQDGILELITNHPEKSLAFVSKYESWMDGTVTTISGDGTITGFIGRKDFNYKDVDKYYKTVNVYKFAKDFSVKYYIPFIEAYIKTFGNNEYYEQVLKVIATISNNAIKALPLPKEYIWYEIDDKQDLDIASILFQRDKRKKYDLIVSRYGGFWRFPLLMDFCYLVNPYYPDDTLIEELKYNFDTLLRNYPSGLKVNSMLLAKYFSLREEMVVPGNGAAETIKCIIENREGKLGVISPSFDEYRNRFDSSKLVTMETKALGYTYSSHDVISFFENKGISTLVLINPDNPSGNLISENEVLSLLNWARDNEILLIVDESFIDFADNSFTLLKTSILDEYKNLCVIKSISKSYGIPGLRLGFLASSNLGITSKLKKDVSIWNINSFAEYYLQIAEKYRGGYASALKRIKETRASFYEKLSLIKELYTLPSSANYFMCRLNKGKAIDLATYLLDKNNILIKVLTDKRGIDGEWIRIAVRTEEENNLLVDAVTQYYQRIITN